MKGKKYVKLLFTLALVLALVAESFILPAKTANAAEAGQMVSITSSKLKKAKVNVAVYINGKKQSAKGFKVSGKLNGKKQTFMYVPAEAFAKAVDATYSIKKKKVTITTGNNWKMVFTSGKDGYTYATVKGKKEKYGPVSLGKSYTKNKVVYVPADSMAILAEKLGLKVETKLKGKKYTVVISYPSDDPAGENGQEEQNDQAGQKGQEEQNDQGGQNGQGSTEEPVAEQLDLSKAAADDFVRRTDGNFEAYTELGLAAALEECMKLNNNWDDPNFVEVKTEVKNDIMVSHEICVMASLVITNDATVTIEKGGIIQASTDILQGCKVIVKDGGKFWTTQGGNINNDSTVIIEKGGEIASMMGGKVINHGTIELNGIFSCGSVRFDGNTGIWFENQGGKVTGNGDAVVSGAYFDKDDPIDLNDCADKLKTELGPDSKIKISIDSEGPSLMGGEDDDQGENGSTGGSVNINLDFNGGEVGMEVDGVYQLFATDDVHTPEMGSKYKVGMMGPLHKDGYELVGWCEKKDGSGKIYKNLEEEITVTGDMTFYAIWEKE